MLRTRGLVLGLALALFPFAFLVSLNLLEQRSGRRLVSRLRASVDGLAPLVAASSSAKALPDLSGTVSRMPGLRGTRLRVLAPGEQLLVDMDVPNPALVDGVLDFLYGVDPPAVRQALDEALGSSDGRPQSVDEFGSSSAESCRFSTVGNLEACAVARRVSLLDGSRVLVQVSGRNRRVVLAHASSLRQLLKLAAFEVTLAVLLVAFILGRLLRPVEQLREQVLERVALAVPKAGIDLARRDEVGDLAEAFNTLLTVLASRHEATETFLSELVHELKNPVAAIRACAERMGDGARLDEARTARLAGILHQSSGQLDALVTQFLELARAEAGLPNETRERFDVSVLLLGLRARLECDLRFAGTRWELDVPTEPLFIRAVPGRIELACKNLLVNALSFAGPSGWVRVRVSRRAREVELSILDSGPGVPPTDLPHLFERFFTTRGDAKGTGLGLALTRAVIEAHGGRIQVESPAGSGALFVVRLPHSQS